MCSSDLRPARPLADASTETLCWMAALAAATPADRDLVAPGLVEAEEAPAPGALLDAARGLGSLHRELAASALSISSVATLGEEAIPAFGDHARWEALSRVEEAYLAEIDGLGFWDRQTARRVAAERGEVDHDGRIVLLATVDVDPLQRRLLGGVRGRIDALVALPPGIGDDPERCFDDFGCIVTEAWEGRPLPVPLGKVVVVDDAEGEAEEVVSWIAGRPTLSPDEITVAVPDAALVPVLEQRFAERGLATRFAAGRPCTRSSPWQTLEAIFAWLRRREFATFAEVVRSPDVAALLRRRTGIADAATVERWSVEEVAGQNRFSDGQITLAIHASQYPEGTEITIRRRSVRPSRLEVTDRLCLDLIDCLRRYAPHTAAVGASLLSKAKELPL